MADYGNSAPPPVFSPSTVGPMAPPPSPSSTESFGQMTGMMPGGETPVSLIRSAGELLLQAAQAAQRMGDNQLPLVIAECLSRLTEASTEAMMQQDPLLQMQQGGGGMPPSMGGGGMPPPFQSPQMQPPRPTMPY